MTCDETSSVRPSPARRRNVPHRSRRSTGSSPTVGSSSTSSSGRPSSAAASDTRDRWPPDSVPTSRLPERARSLVDRAASWFRQGKTGYFAGGWRSSIFAEYAAAWNAFECLVGAICSLNPPRGTNRTEKQQLINDYLASIGRPPTLQDIDFCYSRIVNPGLRHETTHALRLIFGATADQYLAELFSATPQENSLYNIRNDINHANINETKFEDWLRVGRGYARLSLIVRQLLRIAGALPVILDPWIRSCFTCEHKKETDCALGLRPASEQYWKFACDRHTWGKGFPAV